MEDEQCGFDELSAMLNDSDDEALMEEASAIMTENPADEESSDDDIDDDELDRLARLVEQGEEVSPVAVRVKEEKTESDEQRPTLSKPLKEEPKSNREEPTTSKEEQSPKDALAEELRRMKERVMQLESQLKTSPAREKASTCVKSESPKVAAPKPSTSLKSQSASPAPKGSTKLEFSPADPCVRKSVTPVRVGTSRVKAPTAQCAAPRVLKDLEIDLFGSDNDSPPKGKSSAARKPSTPSTRPNSTNSTPRTLKSVNRTEIADRNARACGLEDEENDWDLDGEGGGNDLSNEGEVLKKLLKVGTNREGRVAHTSSADMNTITNRKATWGKAAPKREKTQAEKLKEKEEDDPNISRDPFSGIRIVKPLVSSSQMKARMENRRIIKMSTIYQKAKSSLEGDWVTIGVVVNKSDPKTSQKGNAFSIWTMSDLHDCDRTVKVFLFGETHKTHWKTVTGSVVGILNPSVMQNNEKYQNKSDEVCLTADHPQKMMVMGTSKDLGVCKGRTKAGRACILFVNKAQGGYCTYHVNAAYKASSAKRSELQTSHTGVAPKSFEQKLFGKTNVMYGGKSYTSVPTKKANKVSIKSLVQHGAKTAPDKVTTLSLHPILPEDAAKLKQAEMAKEAEKHKVFHEILTTPTVGSINLVKHLAAKDGASPVQGSSEKKIIKSVTPKDLLLQHQQNMKNLRLKQNREKEQREREKSASMMIDFDEPMIDLEAPIAPAKMYNPLACVPKLGRGFAPSPHNKRSEHQKKKAIFLVQQKGGIQKENPNAVRKEASTERAENIKKRLIEKTESASSSSGEEPPKKKSRLLGDLDLDDPEVKKLLKAKSKHAHKLTEMEEEKQEEYFAVLEKKEAMEEKMLSTYKVECTAVMCKVCKYTAFSALESCKLARHPIVRHKALKRFFSCKDCKRRVTIIGRYPTNPCEGCGSRSFEKTAMMKEKKGPNLPREELLLRGEERKHVNS